MVDIIFGPQSITPVTINKGDTGWQVTVSYTYTAGIDDDVEFIAYISSPPKVGQSIGTVTEHLPAAYVATPKTTVIPISIPDPVGLVANGTYDLTVKAAGESVSAKDTLILTGFVAGIDLGIGNMITEMLPLVLMILVMGLMQGMMGSMGSMGGNSSKPKRQPSVTAPSGSTVNVYEQQPIAEPEENQESGITKFAKTVGKTAIKGAKYLLA